MKTIWMKTGKVRHPRQGGFAKAETPRGTSPISRSRSNAGHQMFNTTTIYFPHHEKIYRHLLPLSAARPTSPREPWPRSVGRFTESPLFFHPVWSKNYPFVITVLTACAQACRTPTKQPSLRRLASQKKQILFHNISFFRGHPSGTHGAQLVTRQKKIRHPRIC